jgi:hypothetical protein
MTTLIVLEDGRILGTSNWAFDAILECAAKQLESRSDTVDGLPEWLLDQRCVVQGPGIGYLDLRELPPRASSQFKSACISAYDAMRHDSSPVLWLDLFSLLINMWVIQPPVGRLGRQHQVRWTADGLLQNTLCAITEPLLNFARSVLGGRDFGSVVNGAATRPVE